MKNLMFLVIAALFLFAGCVKENLKPEPAKLTIEQARELFKARAEQTILQFEKAGAFTKNSTADSRATCNRVPICHNGNTIVVNNSAVPAHLAHGDQLTCCETSCINESAELLNGGPYNLYYDTDAQDCYGYQTYGFEYVSISYSGGFIAALSHTYEGTTHYYVYTHLYADHSSPCDEMVTQEEFQCATAYLRSVIAANSCIPNLCDL